MKILTIIGARPQFVKAAVISRVIKSRPDMTEILVHTGQHFDASMSDVFFEEMAIPKPHYQLGVANLSHGAMTGRMLEKIEEVLLAEKPDWVLVYGDTNSTLAGALAASKLHIPVAHVEAGLRSFNKQMPEEQNRILTDHLSTLLFCPTTTAIENLKAENIVKGVVKTGDVMADAFYFYQQRARSEAKLFKTLPAGKYILATIHRAENTDNLERLAGLCETLNELHAKYPVYLPLHPRTKSKLAAANLELNVHVTDPLGYYDMMQLLSGASLIITDSGGLQKEAYLASKPCLTIREETEWVELVTSGVNRIVGTAKEKILAEAHSFINQPPEFPQFLYGDGKAAEKMIAALSR